ncbi:MAG: protein disulfide oxidoreductase [Myxococcota bacterium]
MALLDENVRNELKEVFKEFDKPVKIKLFMDDGCEMCNEAKNLYNELAEITEKITVEVIDPQNKEEAEKYKIMDIRPATIVLDENGKDNGIRFYGIVAGYEFSSFLETLLLVSTGKHQLKDSTVEFIKTVDKDVDFKIFVTPSCPYCPTAVYIGHVMAYLSNNKITSNMIEVSEFPEMGSQYNVMGVPRTVINDKEFQEGAAPEEMIVEKIKKAIA